MSMKVFFESYRKQVLSDAPSGFVEYAKSQPTLSPHFPTFFSYLQYVTTCINKTIAEGNTKAFDDTLRDHRTGMLELFKKMTAERGPFTEGWKSFKFSDQIVEFENGVHLIPRHGLEKPGINIYASEMQWVKDKDMAVKLIKYKNHNGNKFVKLVNNDLFGFGDLMNFETDEVIEWTAKI